MKWQNGTFGIVWTAALHKRERERERQKNRKTDRKKETERVWDRERVWADRQVETALACGIMELGVGIWVGCRWNTWIGARSLRHILRAELFEISTPTGRKAQKLVMLLQHHSQREYASSPHDQPPNVCMHALPKSGDDQEVLTGHDLGS